MFISVQTFFVNIVSVWKLSNVNKKLKNGIKKNIAALPNVASNFLGSVSERGYQGLSKSVDKYYNLFYIKISLIFVLF